MELFVVKNRKSLEVLQGFNNKMEAKTFRKGKNHKDETGVEILDFIISPGKDHPDCNKKTRTIYRGKKK